MILGQRKTPVNGLRGDRKRATVRAGLALLTALLLSSGPSLLTQASQSDTLVVKIHTPSSAQITFEQGSHFTLAVSEEPAIQPVSIPFTVQGNDISTVSVKPSAIIHVPGGAGSSMLRGAAVAPEKALGYDVQVEFPKSTTTTSSPSRLPSAQPLNVTGLDDSGTATLSADLSTSGNVAHGVVHVHAQRHWTEDGSQAAPGEYSGALEITVTAGVE